MVVGGVRASEAQCVLKTHHRHRNAVTFLNPPERSIVGNGIFQMLLFDKFNETHGKSRGEDHPTEHPFERLVRTVTHGCPDGSTLPCTGVFAHNYYRKYSFPPCLFILDEFLGSGWMRLLLAS